MSSALFTVEGMFRSPCALAMDDLLDHAVVTVEGRLLVPMVELLALVRIDADAELVLVNSVAGASCALRVPEIIERDDMFLQLQVRERRDTATPEWSARLWSPSAGPSAPVASIRATSFAAFVGLA